ncbi:MAG: enoyl-CoA hydratase/isomerase family protein [Chloroflexi bacterium]|nr:enoyl-CoA hydratase/isomerase family protein [Chloroflexota bacterium]
MEFKNIIYAKDDEKGMARIIINRPEVRNALNQATRAEIREAVDDLKKDKNVRVVTITGAGDKAFVAGADITEFKGATPVTMEERASTLGQQLYNDVENLPMPVIAMINGFCLGGGNELAMACDIRIASENAKFGQPEINIGFIPGGGATLRLPRLIGWGRAKELIYTGRIIDAAEAERIGLVDKVVSQDKLEDTVNQLAETIASKSPLITRIAKKAINTGMYTDLAAGLAYEKGCFALCFSTKDFLEGVNAFMEKRKPEFEGR